MGKERQRCKKQVLSEGMNFGQRHQCSRYAIVGGFCRQHSPAAVEVRKRKREAKHEAEAVVRRLRWCGPIFRDALRLIAAGHGNPSMYARSVLVKAGLWEARDDG